MRLFLTGGMGFIGSHTAVELMNSGHEVILYDNLSNASQDVAERIERITGTKPCFIRGDIRDAATLDAALTEHNPDVVIHFAGLKAVGESCQKPLEYYDNNVYGTLVLLESMRKASVFKLIFSSSSTVYGTPQMLPLTEDHPTGGVTNPYGRTKLFIEDILKDLCRADSRFTTLCLRYFNPIGAHASGLIGETPTAFPITFCRMWLEWPPENSRACVFSAMTILQKTAPACAITSTLSIWRADTQPPLVTFSGQADGKR